jgi:hypothetical protein
MTLDEIAYNLLNLYRGGRSNQDEHISLDQIKFNVKHYRAMFIRRDFARNGLVTRHLEQDLGCINLIKVDASKCCDLPINCPIYRTDRKIPKTVRFNFSEAITYTGDVTGLGRIQMVEPYEVQFLMYDKYTSNKPKTYMIEDYLYVYNPTGMSVINIRGIFEDPEKVAEFNTCNGDCYNDKMDFPLPADMLSSINSGIINGELKLLALTLQDTTNNRMQDTNNGSIPDVEPQE